MKLTFPQLHPYAWMTIVTLGFVLCNNVVCACPTTPTEPYFPEPTDKNEVYTSRVLTIYDNTTGEVKSIIVIGDS